MLCGLILYPVPLGGLRSIPGDILGQDGSIEALTGIFFLGPKIEFFAKGGWGQKVQNDQILKNFQVSFFHLFKSLETSGS